MQVSWLVEHLTDPDLCVVDVRWLLGDPQAGLRAYQQGHLPGAVFLDLESELAAPGSGPGRHPIPSATSFVTTMEHTGIGDSTRVVAYDDAGGAIAARLWFLLRYFSHETGAVLDGGIQAWQKAGQVLSTSVPAARSAHFSARPRPELVIDRSGIEQLQPRSSNVLLDARAPERYSGEHEPVDPRAGHIPGAQNAPFSANLSGGRFRESAELLRNYEALGADRAENLVCYCGSGVTACHDLLALELAGIGHARLYEGSWSDWVADPKAPIRTGLEP